MTALLLFFVLVVSLLGAAFCAGAETGFLSVRRGRLLHMAREGGVRAKILYEAVSNMGRTTAALLVGNNLASVAYSSASAAFIAAAGVQSRAGEAILSSLSALAILFFGEFMPKLLFSARPLRRLLAVAPAWHEFARIFVPVSILVMAVVERLMPRRDEKAKMTPETVLKILEDRKDGVKLSDLESALIGRIMVLRSRGEFVIPDTLLSSLDGHVG